MNRPTRNRRELCWRSGVQPAERRLPAGANLAFLRENRPSTYAELKASGEMEHAVAWRLEEVQEIRGEPHSDGDASALGVELGDKSEDIRVEMD